MSKPVSFFRQPYAVLMFIFGFTFIFAFIISPPAEIFNGLIKIILSKDILITDYIEIAGIGATLINASLSVMVSILILKLNKVRCNGSLIMALWMVAGFSFFGKNLANIWPIIFGGWLYAKVQKEPFLNYSLVTLLATSLAPSVSYLAFGTNIPQPFAFLFGALVGVIIGFIMPPISAYCMTFNRGYNLYNVGFSAGLIGMFLMSLLSGIGIKIEPVLFWNRTSDIALVILLVIIFVFLIVLGIFLGENKIQNLKELHKQSGRLISDYYFMYKECAYINMGVLGLFSTFMVLILGFNINGPTIGGIFSNVGFGAFGKHMRNSLPVMSGAIIGGFLNTYGTYWESTILAILFGTGLAPIAGTYGIFYGLIAGYLHVNVVMNLAPLHGGLNLYNNGLAAGLVVMILTPLIAHFKANPHEEKPKHH